MHAGKKALTHIGLFSLIVQGYLKLQALCHCDYGTVSQAALMQLVCMHT